MALEIAIRNVRTGHVNRYWRLSAIAIDAITGTVTLVLSGYADAAARASGLRPDDSREWYLGPAAFATLAGAAASGATVYDVIAAACYGVVRSTRRPLPIGATLSDAGVTLPSGEFVAAADVVIGEAPTIPSEFAAAVDV